MYARTYSLSTGPRLSMIPDVSLPVTPSGIFTFACGVRARQAQPRLLVIVPRVKKPTGTIITPETTEQTMGPFLAMAGIALGRFIADCTLLKFTPSWRASRNPPSALGLRRQPRRVGSASKAQLNICHIIKVSLSIQCEGLMGITRIPFKSLGISGAYNHVSFSSQVVQALLMLAHLFCNNI